MCRAVNEDRRVPSVSNHRWKRVIVVGRKGRRDEIAVRYILTYRRRSYEGSKVVKVAGKEEHHALREGGPQMRAAMLLT